MLRQVVHDLWGLRGWRVLVLWELPGVQEAGVLGVVCHHIAGARRFCSLGAKAVTPDPEPYVRPEKHASSGPELF